VEVEILVKLQEAHPSQALDKMVVAMDKP